MKTVRNIAEFKNEAKKLPYLARHIAADFVLMVTAVDFDRLRVTGTIVSEKGTIWGLGNTNEDWSLLSIPGDWEILPKGSTITLVQE